MERRVGGRAETTWVVVEDDVEEVLVAPGDVVLVLLVKRVQQILPGQASRDHAVLKHQRCLAADGSGAATCAHETKHHHQSTPFAFSAPACNQLTPPEAAGLLN